MAGIVPAIHVAPVPGHPEGFRPFDDVDDQDKPGQFGVVAFTQRASAYKCDFKDRRSLVYARDYSPGDWAVGKK